LRDFLINTTRLKELPIIPKTQMEGATYFVQIIPNISAADSWYGGNKPSLVLLAPDVVLFRKSMSNSNKHSL
jgi:hypothetical protein